ncbi:MAG: glutathione S-transferase family protein [Rhizomicrobium sp.]
MRAKKRKSVPEALGRPADAIELYYWPTPNGWKISIALEEMQLAYVMRPVNIGKGEQFAASFLKISPNGRMPAILDPDGPGGAPISVFESGAILQYLGRKSGKLYPAEERARVQVEEWLYWQVGGLGPMAGQAFHFLNYVTEDLAYPKKRYGDEVHRLFGVMNTRLAGREFLAGNYSIADIAGWGWVTAAMSFQKLDEFPHLKAWQERMSARPAVKKGRALGAELRRPPNDEEKKVLFGQRAR